MPPIVVDTDQIADVCDLHPRPFELVAGPSTASNDPSLDLDWPIRPPLTSAGEAAAPPLGETDLGTVFDRA